MEDEESIKTDQKDHRSTSQSSHSSCKSTPFGRPIGKLSELMAEEKGSSMLRPVGSNKCIKLYVGTYILVSFEWESVVFLQFPLEVCFHH